MVDKLNRREEEKNENKIQFVMKVNERTAEWKRWVDDEKCRFWSECTEQQQRESEWEGTALLYIHLNDDDDASSSTKKNKRAKKREKQCKSLMDKLCLLFSLPTQMRSLLWILKELWK